LHLLSKLFFRLILPILLALALSIVWLFASVGQAHGSFLGWGWPFSRTDPRIFGIAAAAIFLIVFVVNLGMALKWGKEADEYAELLEEEKADELKRRSGRD
jgi:hypothetical protein